MPLLINLHIHSNFSDGLYSPEKIVEMAKEKSIQVLSLTDHDTIAGLPDAFTAGKNLDITIIPGVEFSAIHNDLTMHILGYGFDHTNKQLQNMLSKIQLARQERNHDIVSKLQEMGKDITYREIEREKNQQTGRPHIAQLLVQKGYVKNTEEAFQKYLRNGGPAYVEGYKLSARQTIETIHHAGGLAVLAHPGKLNVATASLKALCKELIAYGLAGLEIYYPRHYPTTIKKLKKIARHFNLLCTGGTDFHGLTGHGDQLVGSNNYWTYPYEEWLLFKEKLSAAQS